MFTIPDLVIVPDNLPEAFLFWRDMESIGLSESESVQALTLLLRTFP